MSLKEDIQSLLNEHAEGCGNTMIGKEDPTACQVCTRALLDAIQSRLSMAPFTVKVGTKPTPTLADTGREPSISQSDIGDFKVGRVCVQDVRIRFHEHTRHPFELREYRRALRLGLLTEGDEIGSVEGYESLETVLKMAYQQAACGKGKERHADSKPFDKQPMQTESDAIGSADGLLFQVRKKMGEGAKFPEQDRRLKEWTGALVYLAGAILWDLRNRSDEP